MKTSSLCIVAVMVTTIITFSQTPENALAEVHWVIKPLDLPADNVELVSADGRKITATVLSKDDKGITIRNAEGKEHFIAWDKLDAKTREVLEGKKSPYKINPGVTDVVQRNIMFENEMMERLKKTTPKTPMEAHDLEIAIKGGSMRMKVMEMLLPMTPAERTAFYAKAKDMDPKLIQTRFVANPQDVELEALTQLRSFGRVRSYAPSTRDMEWEKSNLNWLELIPQLEIKDPMVKEKVSLLDRIKELGMEAEDQTGPECGLAAVHHLAKLAALQAGIKPVSKETLRAAYLEYENSPQFRGFKSSGGAFISEQVVQIVGKVYNRRPTIQWFPEGSRKLNNEMGKHEVRNGRACLIYTGNHYMIVTGFHQLNGKPVWEGFDSNGAWRGGEIKRIHTAMMVFSLRFD